VRLSSQSIFLRSHANSRLLSRNSLVLKTCAKPLCSSEYVNAFSMLSRCSSALRIAKGSLSLPRIMPISMADMLVSAGPNGSSLARPSSDDSNQGPYKDFSLTDVAPLS
jgi:hypothetical protein